LLTAYLHLASAALAKNCLFCNHGLHKLLFLHLLIFQSLYETYKDNTLKNNTKVYSTQLSELPSHKLKNYVEAWHIIEIAKSHHVKAEHTEAQLDYEKASHILNDIRDYKFEAPFYSAWAILEKAEDLSKKNMHEEAAATYLVAKNNFRETFGVLDSFLKKRKSVEDIERISKLIQVAQVRENYCSARNQIETARIESRKGNHLIAAELYNKASGIFENICEAFKIKKG